MIPEWLAAKIRWLLSIADHAEGGEVVPHCRHDAPEGRCPGCAACAACDGSCGACPYARGAEL